jgi:lysozyme family protein
MYTFAALAPEYASAWAKMTIRDDKRTAFAQAARRLYAARDRFAAVTAATGVPMCVIAVIHEREASGNFRTYLGNGEPLSRVTRLVPEGRGPFPSWEAGAIDALTLENAHKVAHWTVERALFVLEPYNGWGYRNRGLRSPYVWAGTNQQQPGKYVSDGVFDPSVMDTQLGCAGLLAALWALDPSWRLPMEGESPAQAVPPKPRPRPIPSPAPLPPPPIGPSPGQQGAIAALVAGLIAAFIGFRDQVVDFLHHLFN